MRSLLQQLDSNESILLMYLAGELPEGDRAEVEQMIARDANLRLQLNQFRAEQEMAAVGMRRLDASQPLPRTEAAGVRHIGRLIRQWQADRLARADHQEPPRSELRFPYWTYPLTAAAAVTIAFVTWWYNLPEPTRLAGDPLTEYVANERDAFSIYEAIELDEGEPLQFASLIAFDEARGLSELEIELQQLQYLRELMQ